MYQRDGDLGPMYGHGRTGSTFLMVFPDNRWIACIYPLGRSYPYPPGGPVVTRDSAGRIRAFMGYSMGKLLFAGDTLEEVYEELSLGQEVFLEK